MAAAERDRARRRIAAALAFDDAARLATARAAFGRLRPAEQDVVALCVWSELDYVAAAQALGIPVGTVRSRLSRARRKLRQLAKVANAAAQQPVPPVRDSEFMYIRSEESETLSAR